MCFWISILKLSKPGSWVLKFKSLSQCLLSYLQCRTVHYSVICESQQVSSCCCQFERNCSKLELLEAVECCRWRSTRWKCRWHFPSPGFGSLAPHGTAASTATVRSVGCPSIALLPTLCRFHFTGGSAIMLCQFIFISNCLRISIARSLKVFQGLWQQTWA